MAMELAAAERAQKVFAELESQSSLLANCTNLWKTLCHHFSSLEKTLEERSCDIESKLQAMNAEAHRTYESLNLREASLPDRESSALAQIEERKLSALADIERRDSNLPEDVSGILRWYARRMDGVGLWHFVVSRRKDLSILRREISNAVLESVDPSRLVLDAVEDYVENHPGGGGSPDRCWALGMLLRVLYDLEGGRKPEVSGRISERAAKVAENWKTKAVREGGKMVGSEAQMLLQIVVSFGLQGKFEQDFLRELVIEFASRKEIPKLAFGLGFGEKLADIIHELGKTGKELEAVHFAFESGSAEKFSPETLLRSYLQSSRKNANAILKNGNNSIAAIEESSTMELNALKSIIKCVETYKLEQKFSIDGLKKRVAELDKAKADRKKTASANKSQSKRTRPTGSASSFRPNKAYKASSASYPSLPRNPPVAPQVGAPRHLYNYPSQVEGPASASYAAHRWSPQQYHVTEDIGGPRSSIPYGGPSAAYGSYDYAAHATPGQPNAYPR